jgi:uncharacterized membrane protein YfcA
MTTSEATRHAKQSRVRVRSGIRLVSFLLIVSVAAAYFSIWWLAKLVGGLAAFFAFATLLEYWNARRWEQRQ